jgi:hypothetical protein
MTTYSCPTCKKSFKQIYHFDVHRKRKYPCVKPNINNTCDSCGVSFSTKSNLRKHQQNTCINNVNDDSNDLNDSDDIVIKELYEKQIKNEEMLSKILTIISGNINNANINNTNANINQLANSINNNNNSFVNISALQYVSKNYLEGPPISALENYDIIRDDTVIAGSNDSIDVIFIKTLSEQYSKNKIVIYLGEIIVCFYKKEKQDEQTFFTSDLSRLTFLAKILPVGSNNIKWISDKSGELVRLHVVCPLLNYIEKSIIAYQKKTKITSKNIDLFSNLVKISDSISDKTLEHNITRYIAPKFILNQPLAIKN